MGLLHDVALAPLPRDLERVEERLTGAVAVEDGLLAGVAGHLLGAGGKRLRPTVTLCAAYAAKGIAPVHADAVTGGAVVELVHIGSLHHDDVIDEAQTRRGVPSVNARWSNIVAILSGDFLLAQASVLAASLGAEVAGLVGRTIGELCRGEILELHQLYDTERTVDAYRDSIRGKTASLLAASARIGGMVSGVDEAALDALTRFGEHLGMCFQIVDDILDVSASEATLGKPAANDLREGVYTLPVIHALARSELLRERLGRPLDADGVAEARALVLATDGVARAMDAAREEARRAGTALDAGDFDREVCARLRALLDGLVERDF